MNLLVGIPAYNEAATIQEVIRNVPSTVPQIDSIEIVVVDDGSSDDTARLAKEAGAAILRHRRNQGVGVAFQSLYRYALEIRTDLLVTLDGDGQFNPADITKLIQPILDGSALVCTASRFLDSQLVPPMPTIKKWGNRRVASLVSSLTGQDYADVSCGFRAYSREALLRLTVYHSYTYTHETFLDLAIKRIAFREVPLKIRGTREHGQSKVAPSVLRYGWRTASIILRTYRDHQPIKLCILMALLPVLAGVISLAWSYTTFLTTGSWLKWAALAGGAFLGVAVAILFFGFMADIASRLRYNQEEILYWLRRGGGEHEDGVVSGRRYLKSGSLIPDVIYDPPGSDQSKGDRLK